MASNKGLYVTRISTKSSRQACEAIWASARSFGIFFYRKCANPSEKCLNFGQSLHLHPYALYTSSSGETALIHSLLIDTVGTKAG